MSITMSGGNVNNTVAQDLMGKSVAQEIADADMTGSEPLVGITASFASNLSRAIDSYCTEADTALSELTTVASNTAFKGTGIETALNNFVEGVRTVASAYIKALNTAETEIVNSVSTVYKAQDQSISSEMNADTGNLEQNAPGSVG